MAITFPDQQSAEGGLKMAEITREDAEFWFVWTKTGHVPRKAHSTLASAETEAQRLAALHPGKKFIVLSAVSKWSAAIRQAEGGE